MAVWIWRIFLTCHILNLDNTYKAYLSPSSLLPCFPLPCTFLYSPSNLRTQKKDKKINNYIKNIKTILITNYRSFIYSTSTNGRISAKMALALVFSPKKCFCFSDSPPRFWASIFFIIGTSLSHWPMGSNIFNFGSFFTELIKFSLRKNWLPGYQTPRSQTNYSSFNVFTKIQNDAL